MNSNWSNFLRLVAIPAVLLCGAVPALADAGLDDYRGRVRQAKEAIEALWDTDDTEDLETYETRIADTVSKVQTMLPARETVIFEGRRVEIDNQWLQAEVPALTELDVNGDEFCARLTTVNERLAAIDDKLNGDGQPAGVGGRDENKARMASILRRAEFNKDAQSGSAWERLKQRIKNWLKSLFPKSDPLREGTVTIAKRISQWIVYGLVVLAAIYAIWKMIGIARNRRSWWPARKEKRERVILGERLSPEKTAADLLSEAEGLARSGDLRAAIRKAYIAFLVELADRNEIKLGRNRTNRDYLRSVIEKRPLYEDMKVLTSSFERHWYGLVPPEQSDWSAFRARYSDALGPVQ